METESLMMMVISLLIRDVHGDNVTITYYDHDYFSDYAKAYIIFQNKVGIVNISLELRYYGSSASNFKFLLYSRCIRGIQRTNFDHRLFNVDTTDYSGTILYFEPLNLNGEKILGLAILVTLEMQPIKNMLTVKTLDKIM